MVRALLAALLVCACAPLHAADSLPPHALHESRFDAFSDADFTFHLEGLSTPFRVHVRMGQEGGKYRVVGMDLSYGSQSTVIGQDMLADIPEPNLFFLWATTVPLPHGGTLIVLYLRNDVHASPVEFDWTVGGGVEKIDYR